MPAAPLALGPLSIDPPVVLAPMAGLTSHPFRAVCRAQGPALFVGEMVTARGIVEGDPRTRELARFGDHESPRSLQLYGTDPGTVAEAARQVVGELDLDHLDLNFGCPVRKITSRGGGAAVPLRPRLLARIVGEVVRAVEPVPVTIKVRMGIDPDHLTYRDAGAVAEAEGCAAIGLHARTAVQLYEGPARWEAIADLVSRVGIPVLGNGDLWEASDASRMMRETGCAGVIVGRGCLGRPWLFRDLAALLAGRPVPEPPRSDEVAALALDHARRMVEWHGERPAMLRFRRLARWYAQGIDGEALDDDGRASLVRVSSLSELEETLARVEPGHRFPAEELRRPRGGVRGRPRRVSLPEGYLPRGDGPAAADPLLVDGG